MSILFVAQHREMAPFKSAIEKLDPNMDVEIWPHVKKPERVQFAVAWNHPKNVFDAFPNLQVISSLGAGVDHLFTDKTIPKNIRFTRVVAPSLSDQMCDYVLGSVLNILQKTETYYDQQKKAGWKPQKTYRKKDLSVGVMGLGAIGKKVTERLALNGFSVAGWSNSKKGIKGIKTFSASQLDSFLTQTNILVCLLPLTTETEGILDLKLFKKLNKPAFVINVARGEHLVEEDLIYSLDIDLINHAILDVFSKEPLPESHPFWGRDKITITPHIASVTDADEVADLLLDNYKRLLSDMDLLYEVDRKKGY
ncbi:MAG: glyoxylate/hydroxypyruvate reductase A [Balneolaceae bacterium]